MAYNDRWSGYPQGQRRNDEPAEPRAPYHFVPLSDTVLPDPDPLPPHDELVPGRHSGEIRLRLRAETPVLISGDFGFRKPDRRLFALALDQMSLRADETLFVGNDMYRDIYGAHGAGMRTVMFRSNQGDQSYHGAEPDYVIDRFQDLPRAVAFLQGS